LTPWALLQIPIPHKKARNALYQGDHPVEYGIMHHQLNPVESVDIFDDEVGGRDDSDGHGVKSESQSPPDMQYGKARTTSIGNLCALLRPPPPVPPPLCLP
jgi:hypothetical protein